MKTYKFSLICCTLNTKIEEFELFLLKLKEQTYSNFELLLVDQNDDNRLNVLIKKYSSFYPIRHIKAERGLSKSRNVGLSYVNGDIVAYPDDDCYYEDNTLEQINLYFNNHDYDGIVIKPLNTCKDGVKILLNVKDQLLTKNNTIPLAYSISLFFKINISNKIGGFDENLGLGTKTIFHGGEDHDYPLRALKAGFKLFFVSSIYVYHPWPNSSSNSKDILNHSFGGGASIVYLLNKHKFSFSFKMKFLFKRALIIFYFAIIKRDLYRMKSSILIVKGMLVYWNTREIK